jgi:stearoyl-CoA desaturase (delta-9 desaturase)
MTQRSWGATLSVSIFWMIQISALAVFLVPFSWPMVGLWAFAHWTRAIGLTLTFHRYFAHRAFKMGRLTQFLWAFIGTAAMQKGPLWWAGHHVTHHKYADRDGDPHSPHVSGFYYAHIGWFASDHKYNKIERTNPVVRDFSKFWELRVMDQHYWFPPVAWALVMYAIGGFQWVAWGFLLPTVTLSHATFCINTVNHLFGSRRFHTVDESRNNVWTAIFAAGEGWHNNHHRYQRSARNGFYWWEFDPTYYTIKMMGWLGLAWDIQGVPDRIYREAERHAEMTRRITPAPEPIDTSDAAADLPGATYSES